MPHPFFDFLRTVRFRYVLMPVIIIGLIIMQYVFTANVSQRTGALRQSLEETYGLALELTRSLGYGGLIHHFKNHLLRSDEPQYLVEGLKAADDAALLVRSLETGAADLGIDETLSETRAMIAGYRARLEQVRALVQSGLSIAQIDDQLRLDDRFALKEIDDLLEALRLRVEREVESVDLEGTILGIVSLTGTSVLSILLLGVFIQHLSRNAYMRSIDQLNTRLARSNASLTEANTSLKQFAGIVSHDLKRPLRHIGLFNEQVIEDIDDPEQIRSHTAHVSNAVRQMQSMIAGLLDFTRTGFKEPECEIIEIADLLQEIVESLQPTIKQKQASVDIHGNALVYADAQLLGRVIYNLLENSLKYIAEGVSPVVRITVKPADAGTDGFARVCVQDNGIGIAPEYRERVFEPMYRLHAGQSPYSGDGIGLSLVKTVVDAHGGDIEVVGDREQGTAICFTLPRDEQSDDVQGA